MGDVEMSISSGKAVVHGEHAVGITADKDTETGAINEVSEAKDSKLEEEIDEIDTCCCGLGRKKRPTKGCCGFELEERPDFSIWEKEDKETAYIPLFFLVIGLTGMCVYFFDREYFEAVSPPTDPRFFMNQAAASISITIIWFPLGCLVWYFGVSVAVTRKITHVFFLTLIPFIAVAGVDVSKESMIRQVWVEAVWGSLFQCVAMLLFWVKPVRKWIPYFRISFSSVERTEDRPFALNWLLMQLTAATMVETPMLIWMLRHKKGKLIFIPFFAVSLGDGLAEPVGKLWGKHKYQVSALFTKRKFTRSYEGSACVYLFTVVSILICMSDMNWKEILLCLLTIPLACTVIEAKSPHTFDNHFMYLGCWILLWLIFDIISPAIS